MQEKQSASGLKRSKPFWPWDRVRHDLLVAFGIIQREILEFRKEVKMTFDELNAKLDDFNTDLATHLNTIAAEITSLKNSGGATPAQLDSIGNKIDAMKTTVDNFSA